ncbi:carbonyl reductase [Phaeosphaeriaceae sp. PMI808]|nr:carbonyl reductase [Phaeosphaeriaceae sp. PMI808]
MSTYSRVGVVTGANKGIGLATVRQLILQYPTSPLGGDSLLIYLTSRDDSKGEAALEHLKQDVHIKQGKALKADGGMSDIKFRNLDITDHNSVKNLADYLKAEHGSGIDFVINNAGIALNGFNAHVVKTTLDCNYFSTLSVCHVFLPLLKPTGRIVNVASSSGSLSKYSPFIRERFLRSKTEVDISNILQEFQDAVEAKREREAGFPSAAYAVSKAGLIGGTRALAKEIQDSGSGVVINSCCPGYVNTDMTKGNGTKKPDDGARTLVWLAIHDFGGKSGNFYKDEKEIEWEKI